MKASIGILRIIPLIVLMLYGGGNFLFAQNTLKAIVLDSVTRAPIEAASLSIKYIGERNPRHYALTDSAGRAVVTKLPTGRGEVRVDYVGYNPVVRTFDVKRGENDMGTVYLSTSNTLSSITVSATGNQMLVKQDTIEFNASSFKVEEADMLEEVIKKLPGVEIEDGKIIADGKEVKKIMIDGKTFFMDDPALASKNIPAKIVEKIRLLDRQSDEARFTGIDDGEEETVLDLSLKNGIFDNWFGNLGGGYGSDRRYEGALLAGRFTNTAQLSILGNANNTNNAGFRDMAMDMLTSLVGNTATGNGVTTSKMGGTNYNYESKNKKLKTQNSYLYSSSDQVIEQTVDRVSSLSDEVTQYSHSQNSSRNKTRGHRFNSETVYSPSENTSFTLKPNIQIGSGDFSRGRNFSTLRNTDSTNRGTSSSFGDNNSSKGGVTFVWRQRLGKPGRTMALVLNYNFSRNTADGNNLSSTYYFRNGDISRTKDIDQSYHRRNTSNGYAVYLTYTEPLGRNYFLQFAHRSAKSRSTTLRNTFDYNPETGAYDIPDEDQTRDYKGDFTTRRYEVSFRKQEKRYNFMLGASLQPSRTKSTGRGKDTSYTVCNFAPTARFVHRFDGSKYLRVTYRGTTSQPSLNQLLPIKDNSNPLVVQEGNDHLNPSFTHNLDTEYRTGKRNRYRWFSVTFRGRYTINSIINKKTYTPDGVQMRQYVNSDKGIYSLDLRLMYNYRIPDTDLYWNLWTRSALNNGISYLNVNSQFEENVTTSLNLGLNNRLSYRLDDFEATAQLALSYRRTWYSSNSLDNLSVWTNRFSASVNWTINKTWNLSSDLNYRFFAGYSEGYGKSQTIWNASVSKTFFRKRMTAKVKVYDILKSNKAISRTNAENYWQDTRNNTLGRYLMFTLLYRFGI
ncbi:MAG: outer membrane beta-barrel protein [Bacteroidales bacterium]|nr:outer membrane beta-barrel protein [Bacteroidales bacterium]